MAEKMSDLEREIRELEQRRQLANLDRENRLLRQETKDLQEATKVVRDNKDKILAQKPEVGDGAGKSSGDNDSGIQGRDQK